MANMRVELQKERDTIVMLQRESQTNNTMTNKRMEDQKVDLDVCKSSVQTLEVQLRKSQDNSQNMGTLLAENKSLNDNLAQCRSQNSNMQGQRDQLNVVSVELNKCRDQAQEANKSVQNLNATLNRVQTQRDEFQV